MNGAPDMAMRMAGDGCVVAGPDMAACEAALHAEVVSGALARSRVTASAPALARDGIARPTAIVVGRDDELHRIRAAHVDVPVAMIYGVAGVGKSTLALEYAARWSGPTAYVRARAELTVAGLAAAVRRALSVVRHAVAGDDGERLDELWALVDRAACLVVIDDLHILSAGVQQLIIERAARALRAGRVVVVSRTLIPGPPGVDHLQLRLEPLDRSASRLLWDRLGELYGRGRDFEWCWPRARGNPLLLRQAHAGALPAHHPLAPAVQGLRPEARRLAEIFAVARRPLPHDVVVRLPLPGVSAALNTLVNQLIVDVTRDAAYQMHDLWRDVVISDREGIPAAAAALVVALPGFADDPLAEVEETAWQLRSLGRHAEIGVLLLRHSTALFRRGATSAILRELDELPAGAMTAELLVLRARCLARGMQLRRAYDELLRLTGAGPRSARIALFLASTATVAGELDHAHQILQGLDAGAALEPELRARVWLGLAWNFASRGDLVEARRLVDELEATAPPLVAQTLPLRVFMLMLERDHERAAELAADWLGRRRGAPDGLWSWQLLPVLCATALAAVGRFDDAEEVVRRMERCLHAPAESLELCSTRMMIRYERGERAAALAYFSNLQRALDRGGHLAGAIWTRAVVCRLLFLLGRRREALGGLAEATRLCRRCRTSAYDQILDEAAREDPLSPGWLTRGSRAVHGKAGDAAREAARAALQIACTGDPVIQGAALPTGGLAEGADHGVDRALVELAHALVARRRGRHRIETRRIRRAADLAAAAGADEDLVVRLYDSVIHAAAPADGRAQECGLVIDGARHELRLGSRRIALGARPVARRLLYAFAGAPSHHLPRGAIARVLFATDYDPLRHDNTLKSNIRRLRALLAGLAELHSEQGGYHLRLPDRTVFIPPVVAPP